jgi:hypothetical protein
VRRREAPPHTIWVLICSDTGGYIAILNELWKNREEEIKEKTWKN